VERGKPLKRTAPDWRSSDWRKGLLALTESVRGIAFAEGETTAGNGTPFTNFCPGTWISKKAVPMFSVLLFLTHQPRGE